MHESEGVGNGAKQYALIENTTAIMSCCSDPTAGVWNQVKFSLLPKILPKDKWVIPMQQMGGPVCLANQEILQAEFNGLVASINNGLEVFKNVRELLIVGHNCALYGLIQDKRTATIQEKRKDLERAAKWLDWRYEHKSLIVRAFFLPETGAQFDEVWSSPHRK